MIAYEFPFNERIRTLLRLEDLYSKVLLNIQSEEAAHHHNAIVSFFQILDLIDRADLKSDLLHELDRQKIILTQLTNNPNIDIALLEPILIDIGNVTLKLKAAPNKPAQPLRENEWLMTIKQRAIIPGGLCEFDLPSYHYWLEQSSTLRQNDLNNWMSHILPIYDSLKIILNIVRGSGKRTPTVATNGAYQQMLGGAKPAQMLSIHMSEELSFYPEISANKYAINIRFISMDASKKQSPCQDNVSFNLTLGNL